LEIFREYGVATHIYIPIIKRGVVDFAVGADWTAAAGDVKISKDGGAASNVTNLPTAITMGNTAMWDFSLTATEMQAAQVMVSVADSATKAVEDQFFTICTYGNASARHKVNLNDSVRAGLTALPNAAAEAAGGLYTRGSGAGQIAQPANGAVDVRLADAVSHGGTLGSSTATLALSRFSLVSQSANTSALVVTGNGTGHGAVITSGSGATGDGLQVTSAATNGNGLVATKTGTGLAIKGATTDLTLAKTTNITGFNDIAATDIVSSGAITTSGGAVSTVTNTTQLNGASTVVLTDVSSNAVIADAVWNAATASYGTAGTYGLLIETDLDATISSRLATAGYTTPPTVTAIADQVWDEALAGHLSAGSTGEALNSAGAAGDPWTTSLPGAYGAGSAGYIIGNNIDAAITSRMASYTQPTGFLAATFPATIASTTNITAGTITTATNVTNVNGLANNVITAASIATGAIDADALATDAVAEIADGVWDEAISGHLTAGSTGAALNAAGSSGDPWTTPLPGAYGAGTAGFIIGTNLDAPVGTVDTVVDAIKAKTDSLTFTVSGKVDSNITHVIADPVQANSTKTTNWGGT
jgi:hypothetical protein